MTVPETHLVSVLDKGFIELVDVTGNDTTVVNAARVSFAKQVAEMTPNDDKLIHYLADHKHVSPFYHPHLSFRVKAPISVQRQWFKHKIGTAENSESTRYIEVKDEFYIPEVFRKQSKSNKQGSSDDFRPLLSERYRIAYVAACHNSFEAYELMVSQGVAKEQAREVLPLCTYTTWIWTASLAAVAHFLRLREDSHAQFEVRQYAYAMREIASQHFPVSLAALTK